MHELGYRSKDERRRESKAGWNVEDLAHGTDVNYDFYFHETASIIIYSICSIIFSGPCFFLDIFFAATLPTAGNRGSKKG